MTDISAGIATLGLEDTPASGTFTTIGELKDPLPGISLERSALDNTGAGSDIEKTRAGMKKISSLTFKIEANSGNTKIADLFAAFESGDILNWEYKYATNGAVVETQTVSAWVQKVETTPAIKDGTFITLTLNVNAQAKS
ncbi:MAG: hypothetical protein RPR40_10255 [Bermanella sp.]